MTELQVCMEFMTNRLISKIIKTGDKREGDEQVLMLPDGAPCGASRGGSVSEEQNMTSYLNVKCTTSMKIVIPLHLTS